MIQLSVVVPVYNEEDNIAPLYSKLKDTLKKIKTSHEIIFVDDGSSDKSLARLKDLKKKDSTIKIIVFRKNFGQSSAISAGFSNSSGEIIIVMDADLQNDPSDISKLLSKLDEGFDVVSGWRYKREDPLSKKIPSKISNWMHKRITGLNIHDSGCTLKAYRKEAVKDIELYGEMHRYIPALISAKGFKIGEVKVEHHFRKFGKSKYGPGRLLKGFLDLFYIHFITKYSSRPLHFFGFWGLMQIFFGILIGVIKIFTLINHRLTTGNWEQFGPLLLFSGLLMIIGSLFIMFGFLSELIIRIYYQNSKSKNYSIKQII